MDTILDSNIIIDCFLDKEYFDLIKKLKNKYKLSYFISPFIYYESYFVILKHGVSRKLIKKDKITIDKIVKRWSRPFEIFEILEDKELREISTNFL